MSAVTTPLLEVRNLTVAFETPNGRAAAVRDVTFGLAAGEIVGMVGESGSGKSMTALAIMGLLSESAQVTGEILFQGNDLLHLSPKSMAAFRGAQIGMIFQEPMTALDPVFTIGSQLVETVRSHETISRRKAKERAIEMLSLVGIPDPRRRIDDYPHQLSGGMRQRVMIAIALVCEPLLLIADEPTTAVDVTVQAQILELVQEISDRVGAAVLLITHDLGVVAEVCSRVLTLYAGELVEAGAVASVLARPAHPYTSALLEAIPRIESRHRPLLPIAGRVPPPTAPAAGCLFLDRCRHSTETCARPQTLALGVTADRTVRCCRSDELVLTGIGA